MGAGMVYNPATTPQFKAPPITPAGGMVNTASKAAGYAGTGLSVLNAVAPKATAGMLGAIGISGAPATLGLSLAISAIPLVVNLASKIRQGARTADEFVKGYQDAFLQQVMAPISQMAQSDPDAAKAKFAEAWTAYLGEVNKFAAENPTHAKVVDQMLHTPEFMNTAQALLPPGKSALDPSYTQGSQFQNQNTNTGPSMLSSAVPLIASGAADVAGHFLNNPSSTPNPGSDPNAAITPGAPTPQTEGGGTDLSTIGKVAGAAGGIAGGGTGGVASTATKSLLQTLLPGIAGGIQVAGDIYGANASANAATEAIRLQTDAAAKATQLQADTASQALKQQQSQFDTTQANQQPWLDAGKQALGTLTGTGAGSLTDLTKPFDQQFQFTADDLLKDPGYERRLTDAQQALERSASSKGNLFSAGTSAAIANKVGAQASDEYGAAYNRAQQDYLNKYNIYTGNQNNAFNKEASVAGLGQTANQSLASAGQANVANSANIAQTSTTNINDLLTSLANAQAKNNQTATNATNTGINNTTTDLASMIQAYLKKAA